MATWTKDDPFVATKDDPTGFRRLQAVEELAMHLKARIERVESVTDVNTSNIEDMGNRISDPIDPVMRRREMALHMALNHRGGAGSASDIVADAHAYRRFLEGVDS